MSTDSFEMVPYNADELSLAIHKADAVLGNRILIPLRDMEIVPFPSELERIKIEEATWLFKLDRLSIKSDSHIEEKLTNVIKAIHLSGATLIILLSYRNGEASYYIGAVNKGPNSSELLSMKSVLESGIKGNFPGTSLSELSLASVSAKIEDIFGDEFETQCVTSISGAASRRDQERDLRESIRGIETMIESIGDTSFSLVKIADRISNEQLTEIRLGYENLGSQLSSFQKIGYSQQRGENTSTTTSSLSITL